MKPMISCLVASLVIVLAGAPPLASAETAILSDEELDGQRGGLRTPMGLDVGFGASVKTFVDGTLALETRITWTDTGLQSEQVVNALSSIAGAPVRLGTLSDGTLQSVTAGGMTGGTTLVHDLTMDRIASLVINTADNRTIRQETDVTLVLPQLVDFQQRIAADRLSSMLSSSVGLAMRDAATTR